MCCSTIQGIGLIYELGRLRSRAGNPLPILGLDLTDSIKIFVAGDRIEVCSHVWPTLMWLIARSRICGSVWASELAIGR